MRPRMPSFLARIRTILAPRLDSAPVWTIDGGALRFHRDHTGETPISLELDGTSVRIERGARIGRGTRIHLLGGAVSIASDCVLGESVDIRSMSSTKLEAGCAIEDFTQLQSDTAPLIVGPSTRVGRASRLWAHRGPINIGAEVAIGPSNTWIGTGTGIHVAARCDFAHGVTLDSSGGRIDIASRSGVGPHGILYGHGGLRIGTDVAIAGLTMIVPGNHRFDNLARPIREQGVEGIPITIDADVWIGGGVIILGGSHIGTGVVVGAGAVVRGVLAPRTVVGGIPAREIARRHGDSPAVEKTTPAAGATEVAK